MNNVFKLFDLEDTLDLYIYNNGNLVLTNEASDENRPEFETEVIDSQIERDLNDDIDIPENETEEARIFRIKRYQNIVNRLKFECNYKCQICGDSFLMDNGKYYCEAHHIKLLSKGGTQSPENVLILCSNHHRMFHYAANSINISDIIDGKRTIEIKLINTIQITTYQIL